MLVQLLLELEANWLDQNANELEFERIDEMTQQSNEAHLWHWKKMTMKSYLDISYLKPARNSSIKK